MPVQGKTNASQVNIGDRIVVEVTHDGYVLPSKTRTGEGRQVVQVTDKDWREAGRGEVRGKVILHTSAGTIRPVSPIQTFWMAPEDAADVKRAHAEEQTINRPQVPMPFQEPGDEYEQVVFPVAQGGGTSISDALRDDPEPVATPPATGSAVVTLLEQVWTKIREQSGKELPEVVIVTGSAYIGPARWGHFRAAGWTGQGEGASTDLQLGEMFIAGETLAKGAAHVLETMLHEASHVLAKVREVKDTSRQGRWHNQAFRGLAEELGLTYRGTTGDPSIGFSEVVLTEETRVAYAALLTELEAAIRIVIPGSEGRGGERIGPHGGRRQRAEGTAATGNVKATCLCDEPRIIRASKSVLDGAGIRCDDCDATFRDRS